MSQLLEHILNGDYVSANELFEERMVELQEKKLYEVKRMVAEAPEYSPATKAKLAAGKRLLTPAEREAGTVYHSSEAPKNAGKKSSGLKPLAPKGSVRPKALEIGARYQKALDTAKDLESRGSTGKVAKVKKLYRPYRVARAVGKGIAKVGQGAKAALSDFGSQYGSFEE